MLRRQYLCNAVYLLAHHLLNQFANGLAAGLFRTAINRDNPLKLLQIFFIFYQLKIADRNLTHTAFSHFAGGYNLKTGLQFAFQMILIKPHQHCIAVSAAYMHP